jgi:hypothetical protein
MILGVAAIRIEAGRQADFDKAIRRGLETVVSRSKGGRGDTTARRPRRRARQAVAGTAAPARTRPRPAAARSSAAGCSAECLRACLVSDDPIAAATLGFEHALVGRLQQRMR